MSISQITTNFTGEIDVNPRLVRIVCNDTYATVITAGYLNQPLQVEGLNLLPTDVIFIIYGSTPTAGIFTASISQPSGVITLAPYIGQGNVTLPVTTGDFAVFANSSGAIKDVGYLPSNAAKTVVAMLNGATNTGNIPSYADTSGTLANSALALNTVLTSTIVNPDTSIDLVSFDVSITSAQLASGGSVILLTSSGSRQYKIRVLQMSPNTNFAGGGGNRLGQVTDGVVAFSLIPAASMQSIPSSAWGAAALPFPGLNFINQNTAAGANLVFAYQGGTTDYTTGNLIISGIAQRVV